MAVNKSSTLRRLHLTRENSYYEALGCSITFFGVTHTSDYVEDDLEHSLDQYQFDSVLYEEHIRNGFDPEEVDEHSAIQSYVNNNYNVDVRSMDIPENSDHMSCLAEVMSELADEMPAVRNSELTSEDGMISFNGRYEAEYPQLYSYAHEFRNDKMSIEIIREARKPDVDHIAVVVGKAHIFGSGSIMSKMDQNIENYNVQNRD